jgi:pre-mRNA-splicing factor SYF1
MSQLWHAYLDERRAAVRGLSITHPAVDALNNTYERALVTMHKMPRMWLYYLEHLMGQKLLTRTRRIFDRALCSLPITQHDRIWVLFLVRPRTRLPAMDAMRHVVWFLVYGNLQRRAS